MGRAHPTNATNSIMLGDLKQAKSVFDLDSSQLLATVRTLEKGKDLGGNELDGAVEFCAGHDSSIYHISMSIFLNTFRG